MPIASSSLPRIDRLIRLLSSPVEGERLGAVHALERVLKADGATFHDLAEHIVNAPKPGQPDQGAPWQSDNDDGPVIDQRLARRILETYTGPLSQKDRDFLINIAGWRGPLSQARRGWLSDIYDRVRAWGWQP